MIRIKLTTLIAAALLTVVAAAAEPVANRGPRSLEPTETEQFLRAARIIQRGPQVEGEEQAYLATMSDGVTTRTVMVQTLQPYRYSWFRSRDSLVYNAAAYQLDRMVGAGVAPCTVLREVEGRLASVSIWRSDVGANAADRDPRVALFRALVGDAQGAFTSGFYTSKDLSDLEDIAAPDEQFLGALSGLDRKQLNEQLGELLTPQEIRYLLARRDQILRR